MNFSSKQTNEIICFQIKILNVLVFSFPGYTKGSKIERVMVVQKHADHGENREFFLHQTPYGHFSLPTLGSGHQGFEGGIKKNSPFSASSTCI